MERSPTTSAPGARDAFHAPDRPRSARPNIVTILLDDVGFAQIGAFGAEIATPNIDALARGGLLYNRFHVTSICSASRASLFTGRNHHAVGMGSVADSASKAPGYTSRIPATAAALPRVLRDAGYSTIAIGKWHMTPNGERSHAGPFRQWPLGLGFERYYGFLRADANQWTPNLVCDNHSVDPPAGPDDGYHLTEDLADKAIAYVLDQKHAVPERPFYLHFATGAMHAPHQVGEEWSNRYAGAFDDGWEAMRERIFARQVEAGVVPRGTTLSARPSWIQDWNGLTDDDRRLFARMHEVYAGFMTHTDAQIGRIVAFLDEIDELDNTLLMVMSDNGASAEGGEVGAINEHHFTQRIPENHDANLAGLDDWGGQRGYYHYAWGWAWAGNTPLRLWKRYAWLGGTRTPLIVHWPKGIAERGVVRSQFCHIVDVLPTVLDVCGIDAPAEVDGVAQQPIDGASLTATFADGDAPNPRDMQYFEMMGSRGIFLDEWKATTDHVSPLLLDEQRLLTGSFSYESDRWSLFDLRDDFAEADDVADQHPDICERLTTRWMEEAGRNQVFPMMGGYDPRPSGSAGTAAAPPATFLGDTPHHRRVFRSDGSPITDEVIPKFVNGGTVEVVVEVPGAGAQGVICAIGDWTQGWALYVRDGRLVFCLNVAGVPAFARAQAPVPPGRHTLGVRLDVVPGGGLTLTLTQDGIDVGSGASDHGVPIGMMQVGGTGLCIGYDRGFPVTDEYSVPGRFSGLIDYVAVQIPANAAVDPSARIAQTLHED